MEFKVTPKEKPTVDRSKLGKRSRAKGSAFERSIAKIFKRFLGIDFVRTPQSGGFAKTKEKADGFRGDIVPVDSSVDFRLHVEAKNAKTISLPKWLAQAQEDCPEGKKPVVIFHQHNSSKDFIVLNLLDFFELVDKEKIVGSVRV